MTKDAIAKIISNIDLSTYAYFEQYDKESFDRFTETRAAGQNFDLRLYVGDLLLLENLPKLVKELPIDKIKKKNKKYTAKRKFHEINDENSNVLNVEPVVKKNKTIEGSVEQLSDHFAQYAKKISPGSVTAVNLHVDKNPTFSMICGVCKKYVVLSYKITKKNLPSFVRTNWDTHPCNKKAKIDQNVIESAIVCIIDGNGHNEP